MLVLCGALTMSAQSFEQWTAWGDAASARGEYYGASRFYAGALDVDPGRMSVQWKQAEACRLSHQYGKAAEHYEKVQRKDMGRTHPTALHWLAEMQMCQSKYREATSTWRKVLQKEKDKQSFTAKRAGNGIAGCELAMDTVKGAERTVVEHLPQPVNSYDSEFGARIGPDSLLYFASLRGDLNKEGEVVDTAAYHTGLLRVALGAAAWNAPEALTAINTNGDNANATWTLDGKWILFTRCVEGSPCRIHIASITDRGSDEARVLPGIGDTLLSTQPMVVRWLDREMLLFVSDRSGGQGGTDIWQAELIGGEAKYIYPLDRPVNTPGNERCPWYDNTSNALWYSSDFLPGFGGYDIFSAAFGDDLFANPVNAGRSINSAANDLYPVYDPVRGEGWLTSNRIGSFAAKGETCCNDLYRFTLPKDQPVVELVLEPEPIRPLTVVEQLGSMRARFPLMLYFHNDEPEPRSWATTTPQTYGETYTSYMVLQSQYEKENVDPMAIREHFVDDVAFGFSELGEFAQVLFPVLEEGRTVTVETRGHASPLARNEYNRNLSMRRIESLRNHLRNVDGGRLLPYLNGTAKNGAKLEIRELPFGEEQSAQGVSDDLGDLQHSVYSVQAARERRIEVVALQLLESEKEIDLERQTVQVGDLLQGEEKIVRFTLRNDGDKPMKLLHAEPDCGCTTAKLPEGSIVPGGSTVIEVVFNGHAPEGPLRRTVMIDTDGEPKKFQLNIDGRLVP